MLNKQGQGTQMQVFCSVYLGMDSIRWLGHITCSIRKDHDDMELISCAAPRLSGRRRLLYVGGLEQHMRTIAQCLETRPNCATNRKFVEKRSATRTGVRAPWGHIPELGQARKTTARAGGTWKQCARKRLVSPRAVHHGCKIEENE
jgi:hypothetical protein